MLLNNLKIAFRSLLRRRTYSLINIAGLSLGMTAAIFAFLWVQNEHSFDSFHPNTENIYRINADLDMGEGEIWKWALVPYPMINLIKNEVPEVVRTAFLYTSPWRTFTVKKNASFINEKHYGYINEDWFKLFNHEFIEGQPDGFFNSNHNVILTRDFAVQIFGNHEAVGETLQIGEEEFIVHAIIENHPSNSSFVYQVLLPIEQLLSKLTPGNRDNWGNFNYLTLVGLRPDADPKELGKKLTALLRKYKENSDKETLSIQPFRDLHFDQERTHAAMLTGSRNSTRTTGIIGFIILLLACINYMSLTTAQAGMRTKEVGVRKIIGAGGNQIFNLLFSESLITVFVAMILALGLVQLALPAFNNFTEKDFLLNPLSPNIWLVAGGTLVAALLMSGIYPALFLKGFAPGHFLRGKNFLKLKNTTFRKGLVVTQFAVTVALIIGAAIIFQQQNYIQQKDLGYDRSHIFELTLPYTPERVEKLKAIRQTLDQVPSITGTSASNSSLVNAESTHSGSVDWVGRPADFVPTVSKIAVDPDFGDLVQLKLKEGRWFEHGREADLTNVLLNETAVKLFNLPEPTVGLEFEIHGQRGQVIGVLKDFHFQSLRNNIEPLVVRLEPRSLSTILVKTKKGQVSEAIAAARAAWEEHTPGQPFEYLFMDDSFDRLYKNEGKNASLFQFLAGLALFISCLGLFGLAVFSTQQRTKEIGIRKVLGATTVKLIGLLSSDFLKLVFTAMIIASPIAYFFAEQWLQDFAYRISIQWWVFVMAGMVAVAVAFLTVGFQSLKAALANPVESLRNE